MAKNTTLQQTVEAWADITLRQWTNKIIALKLTDTYALYDSLIHHINSSANGDVQRIEFAFNYYGKFLDMGVGRGQKIGEEGNRKPQKWFSATFFANTQKLKEIIGEKYAQDAIKAITQINSDDNARYRGGRARDSHRITGNSLSDYARAKGRE